MILNSYDIMVFSYLHSGFVELDVVESLFVTAHLALQLVHSDGFLSQCVQLITVSSGRARLRQQLEMLNTTQVYLLFTGLAQL